MFLFWGYLIDLLYLYITKIKCYTFYRSNPDLYTRPAYTPPFALHKRSTNEQKIGVDRHSVPSHSCSFPQPQGISSNSLPRSVTHERPAYGSLCDVSRLASSSGNSDAVLGDITRRLSFGNYSSGRGVLGLSDDRSYRSESALTSDPYLQYSSPTSAAALGHERETCSSRQPSRFLSEDSREAGLQESERLSNMHSSRSQRLNPTLSTDHRSSLRAASFREPQSTEDRYRRFEFTSSRDLFYDRHQTHWRKYFSFTFTYLSLSVVQCTDRRFRRLYGFIRCVEIRFVKESCSCICWILSYFAFNCLCSHEYITKCGLMLHWAFMSLQNGLMYSTSTVHYYCE